MKLSGASRTVLVMLLGIAFLELGISGKFSQVWQLAFASGSSASANATAPVSATAGPSSGIQNPTAAQHRDHQGVTP